MKLLRLRRNVVKLSLYRHFTNTLIFAVIGNHIWHICSRRVSAVLTPLTPFSIGDLHHLVEDDLQDVLLPVGEYRSSRRRPACVSVTAAVCRTGGSCGSTTPSGPSSSPSSCWSSCSCGAPPSTTRGGGGGRPLAFPGVPPLKPLVSGRYAFSPLLDEDSEEEEKEAVMNEAFGGNSLLLVNP